VDLLRGNLFTVDHHHHHYHRHRHLPLNGLVSLCRVICLHLMEGILLQGLVVWDHHFLHPLHRMAHQWMTGEILTLLHMVFIPVEETVEIEIEIVVVAGAVDVKVDNTVVVGNTVAVVVVVVVVVQEEGEGRIYHRDLLILVGRGDKRVMMGVEEVPVVVGKILEFSFLSIEEVFFFCLGDIIIIRFDFFFFPALFFLVLFSIGM
jgi:hypothetical protein